MATHPDFPNLEVTTVPTPEKFYQPQSGDGIILIAKKAYPGMNATDGAHIISNSSHNRKHHGYAMGGSYNCKSKVNAQTPNALIVLCAKPWPLVWIPQLASRAEPESYGPVFVPGSTGTGTGQEATPGGGAATMTTKKPWTTWQKVGLGLVVVSALAVGYILYSGKRGRWPVRLPAHGLRGIGGKNKLRLVLYYTSNDAAVAGAKLIKQGGDFADIKVKRLYRGKWEVTAKPVRDVESYSKWLAMRRE